MASSLSSSYLKSKRQHLSSSSAWMYKNVDNNYCSNCVCIGTTDGVIALLIMGISPPFMKHNDYMNTTTTSSSVGNCDSNDCIDSCYENDQCVVLTNYIYNRENSNDCINKTASKSNTESILISSQHKHGSVNTVQCISSLSDSTCADDVVSYAVFIYMLP
jgi:hypothetical protein